ncbi:MAG: AtpZ/AtpI family protein [Candidatus Aquicultor sp.]|nr:AtpZ/AtpI family protein [Candidatus Aquicultor sp.]
MLQSDDDRWPMWETRHASDEDVERTGKGEAVEKKPTEHKESDKKITTSKDVNSRKANSSKRELIKLGHLGTELLAAVLVGTLIGWAIGRLVPRYATAIMLVSIILGAAAGFLNIYRAVIEMEQEEERQKRDFSE